MEKIYTWEELYNNTMYSTSTDGIFFSEDKLFTEVEGDKLCVDETIRLVKMHRIDSNEQWILKVK